MHEETSKNSIVYSKQVIEFVTVAVETCLFLEQTENNSRKNFISQSVKILPLLYLKAVVLELPEQLSDFPAERFVSEDDYQYLSQAIEKILGSDNVYLEVFTDEIKYSDTPVAAFISENLSDIYQEIKDFALNYRLGVDEVMNDALVICLEAFAEHWGQKLLNALRALHALHYAEDEDAPVDELKQEDRNAFLDFLRDE